MSAEQELAQARDEYEGAREWLNPTPVREEPDDRQQ